ncbi:MAG: hypothetical protein ACRC9Q_05965 [Bacteroidales bacterium]
MKQFRKVMLTLLSILFATSVFASNKGWDKLGQVTTDVSLDRISVSCDKDDTFKSIKFKVTGANVNFVRVNVRYGNGVVDNLNFNQSIQSGSYSNPIDLRGNRREIKEVILFLKSEGKDKKGKGKGKKDAKVEIWGQK